ncbi:MAG: hypothetical protein ACKO5K_10230 [Armatimonadota bacterium]
MNERSRAWHWCAWGVFLLAVVLQACVAHRLRIGSGQPDFPLTIAVVAGALGGPVVGANLGFAAGGATAGLSGEAVGTMFVSRTFLAWSAGAAIRRWIRPGIPVAIAAVGAATVGGGLILALAAPQLGTTRILLATVSAVPWNMAIALPVAWLLASPRLAGGARAI